MQRMRVLPETYTVTLQSGGPPDDGWLALVRGPEGLTAIRRVDGESAEPLWRALYGDVSHGLDVPGMLAALLTPLAGAGVPVFVASTFHSDLVLVPADRLGEAVGALRGGGFEVVTPSA